MKHLRTALLVTFAFLAGIVFGRAPQSAHAAAPPPQAASLDLMALDPATFPPPNSALPNLRSKTLASVDSTVFAVSVGTAPKHLHEKTTEVQVVLAGTGSEWLGDKQVAIEPGTFLVIPPNTAHGGLTGGPFRIFTIKTPPQLPDDYHLQPEK
jgi:mannose-6-phosphate isomerase-like protein (cupin superfamily)